MERSYNRNVRPPSPILPVVAFKVDDDCPDCDGVGTVFCDCDCCDGSGDGEIDGEYCGCCNGEGEVIENCGECNGTGKVTLVDFS